MVGKMNKNKTVKYKIIKHSENVYLSECRREDNLRNIANSILTSISIVLAVLMELVYKLLENLQDYNLMIVSMSFILCLILLISLFCAILTNWPYKKSEPNSGRNLLDFVNNNLKTYVDGDGFLDQRITDLDEMSLSLFRINNIKAKFLVCSCSLLICFIVLTIIFSFVILYAMR